MPLKAITWVLTAFTIVFIVAIILVWSMEAVLKPVAAAGVLFLVLDNAFAWYLTLREDRVQGLLSDRGRIHRVTNLPNRKHTILNMTTGLKSAARHKYPYSVIVLGLDNFGDINDRFGRKGGDIVMRQVGELLEKSCRGEDLVGHFESDRFLVGAPHTDGQGGIAFAKRLHRIICSTAYRSKGGTVRLSVSMGVVTAPPISYEVDEVIQIALFAMQKAKEQGKNRIFTEGESLT